MREQIKANIRHHHLERQECKNHAELEACIDMLADWVLLLIAEAEKRGHDRKEHLLKRLVAEVENLNKQVKESEKKFMIAQSVFDASLKGLTDAVANVTSGAPSTPDSVVQAYVTGVDTNTAHLLAGSPTPPPPPTP